MMYIDARYFNPMLNTYTKPVTKEWHIGENSPIDEATLNGNALFVVYADGDELLWVVEKFSGLPMRSGRSTTWSGEFARFIVSNLVG